MEGESLVKKDGEQGPSKARQIFLYIAPFPALAFFKIWASLGREAGSLLIAACAMLVYCAALWRWQGVGTNRPILTGRWGIFPGDYPIACSVARSSRSDAF